MAIFASATAFSLSTQKNRISERKRIRDSPWTGGVIPYRTFSWLHHPLGSVTDTSGVDQETSYPWESSSQVFNPEFTDGPVVSPISSSLSKKKHTGKDSHDSEHPTVLFMGTSTSEDQRQFEMHVGKAVDTLRHDYPNILVDNPGMEHLFWLSYDSLLHCTPFLFLSPVAPLLYCVDFSIYDPHITVVDPSGVKLHNLNNYKTSLQFLHAIIHFFYCTDKSGLTFRVHYDGARRNIRVSWNAILIPRIIYGGIRNRLHVDGISVYELDYMSGLINQHRIERLLINDAPVQAPQGIFLAIAREAMSGPEGIPILSLDRHLDGVDGRFVMEFQQGSHILTNSSLFSDSNTNNHDLDLMHSMAINHPLFNQEGYDKKNASRKKFGLPPISPSEYVDIQVKVQELDGEQRAKASAVESSNASDMKQKRKGNVLEKIFGNTFESTCESNFDCERPEICCDFGFVKRCCRSGLPIFDGSPAQLQPKLVPVRAGSGLPRGGPEGMEDYY